jgi:hypothetical protein
MDEDDGQDGSLDASEHGADADDDVSAEGEAPRHPWQRPDNLSEDDLVAWKEKQGLPQTEADYQIDLPEGQEITEAGRPIVDSFLGFAVEHDLPEATVNKAIQWFNEHAVEAQSKRDAARKRAQFQNLVFRSGQGQVRRRHAGHTRRPDAAVVLGAQRRPDRHR